LDFEKHVIDKLEIIDTKISDLCQRVTANEVKIEGVVTQKVNESQTKYKIITIVFGVITALATIKSILKL